MPGERGAGRAVLRAAVAGQRRRVVTASLLGMGHQACEVLVPVVIGLVIDEAVATGDTAVLLRWLLVLGVLFLAPARPPHPGARPAPLPHPRALRQTRLLRPLLR
ncbi:ABC transporter ATP-binding protein, partial [Streptomyces zhihengii]